MWRIAKNTPLAAHRAFSISTVTEFFSGKSSKVNFCAQKSSALFDPKWNDEPNTSVESRMNRMESAVSELQSALVQARGSALGSQINGENDKHSASKHSHSASPGSSAVLPLRTLQSVVKIYCTTSHPNFMLPWQRKQQASSTGSGFVLDAERKLVITNAHVVISAAFIEVRRHGGSSKFTAELKFIAADCDLALLSVQDSEFWDGISELDIEGATACEGTRDASSRGTAADRISRVSHLGGLPELQQNVKVVGYPWGGDQLSITSGVVSRIDSSPYGGIDVHLMAIQIDAAINPGNSGGPALSHNRVVGIAFQALVHGDNIGYIIPIPIIAHFLREYLAKSINTKRYTAGHYHPGFCSLGAFIQELHNTSLRRNFSLRPSLTGVLLLDMLPLSAASSVLKAFDVVTHVDGHTVGNDATLAWRGKERVRFSHLIQMRKPGDVIPLRIFRKGEVLDVQVPLSVNTPLVSNHLLNGVDLEKPMYRLFGGCVFTQLTFPLLTEWGAQEWFNTAPRHLVDLISGGKVSQTRDGVVVLLQMLPHNVNKGYQVELMTFRIATHVNNVEVRNLSHFGTLLDGASSDLVHIRLMNSVNSCSLILPAIESREADDEIRQLYNIPKALENSPAS